MPWLALVLDPSAVHTAHVVIVYGGVDVHAYLRYLPPVVRRVGQIHARHLAEVHTSRRGEVGVEDATLEGGLFRDTTLRVGPQSERKRPVFPTPLPDEGDRKVVQSAGRAAPRAAVAAGRGDGRVVEDALEAGHVDHRRLMVPPAGVYISARPCPLVRPVPSHLHRHVLRDPVIRGRVAQRHTCQDAHLGHCVRHGIARRERLSCAHPTCRGGAAREREGPGGACIQDGETRESTNSEMGVSTPTKRDAHSVQPGTKREYPTPPNTTASIAGTMILLLRLLLRSYYDYYD